MGDEFVHATRSPISIFEYADKLKAYQQTERIVCRFRSQDYAWYKDTEEEGAEKTLNSIPPDRLWVAKFEDSNADVSPKTAQEAFDRFDWKRCSDVEEMLILRLELSGIIVRTCHLRFCVQQPEAAVGDARIIGLD